MSQHSVESLVETCEFELEGAVVIYRLIQDEVARGEKSPVDLHEARLQVRGAISNVRAARRALDVKRARYHAQAAEIADQAARRVLGELGSQQVAALDAMLGDDAHARHIRRSFDRF